MELREVIGRRRSIRFLCPHRPVELHKIQRMLEAARLASHWGNVGSLRAIVVQRDQASKDVLDALPSPVGGVNRMVTIARLAGNHSPRHRVIGIAFEREIPGLRELLQKGSNAA